MTTPTAPAGKIIVLTTGGTISCTVGPHGALIPTVSGAELLAPIQERFKDQLTIEVIELHRLDSSSMTFSDIDEIVKAAHQALQDPEVLGVVVTHGTDSMEETAIALDTFHTDSRPIVLTGAQKPHDHPQADGPTNLFEAIVVAADSSARDIGVLIVFGRAVLPARGVTKWHTTDELAFGTNAPEEPLRADPVAVTSLANTRIDIIPGFPGAPRTFIDAAIAAHTQGIVVEAMGSGNVGTELGIALGQALDQGIPVVISTRVPRGEISGTYGGAGGGATLAAKGAVGTTYFRAGQARVLLAIAVASGVHPMTLF
ncbi:L-asparaginase [Corynebacterium kutscheri]|uniref:asparaginase n=1 Tax=Corynebacterium kutscheri TaxID=35755 RepID=A0A0F6R2B7_9CORY|nr:asparaginase [Corynebacterium kutscheri]AKE41548.1 L-asparaginase/GlutRNAGln amidotransferase subunit D [Corynebacterium kutscheri]VEH08827.1 L-asparaginase [Corynebacterium kutscheri]VEH09872.1 L-asparaginase [Corynebacterium kutscheri]VEH79956.1 L-asparaginase [Corynebacterium kutscheri]